MAQASIDLTELSKQPIKGHKSLWSPLNLTEKAFAISQKVSESPVLQVVLVANSAQAAQLEEAIAFFNPEVPIIHFPEWETLPYDQFAPHQDIISQRLKTLYQLPHLKTGVLILPVPTLIQRVAPYDYIQQNTLLLKTGDTLNLNEFSERLQASGYIRVSQVVEHGEFAIRGAIIDLFPMGSQTPFRLDLFDDEIETIRCFDPETQRSTETLNEIELLPAKEYPLDNQGIAQFRTQFRTLFSEQSQNALLYQAVSKGQTQSGLEYYLPLFHEETATLFDYLPNDALFFEIDNALESIQTTWSDYQERYDIARHNPDYPVLAPSHLILSEEAVMHALKQWHRIQLLSQPHPKSTVAVNKKPLPDVTLDAKSDYPLAKLNAFLDAFQNEDANQKLLIVAETAGRRETLLNLLAKYKHHPKQVESWAEFLGTDAPFQMVIGPLEEATKTEHFTLLTESQIFGQTTLQKRRRKKSHADFSGGINNLIELEVGQPIVHIDHGVGRYQGLQTLELQGQEREFLTIEYAGGDKLYVPVTSLHLVSRYSGTNPEHAPLHKLGTDKWDKAKRKAAEKAYDVAAELLDIYAQREAKKGHAFETPEEAYLRFCAGFPFEETPDQQQAIEAVIQDLKSDKPMDRLICGDVGFGKTEVAMRAAFIAAYGGKQVAILVPTTLLAQQHFENFQDRFADWPIRIGLLSRFQTAKQQKQIQQDIIDNKIDIIIGTHKLIQKEMQFGNLGLIIIDEEHRFGVRQKEILKKYRTTVDTLTMTATPIPRTLNMAMNDLRDLSIIATPPEKRLAVQTFVQQWNPDTVKEACLREIRRGGQVYVLFNDVKKIDQMAQEIADLLPEAKVDIAHGQMHEKELEQVMQNFYHRRFNILVCTTIIETGIDIPTANTILIHRADKFGLAQLHQLRGRVGRSHHRAYAYLFTPEPAVMTDDAKKRLEAIAKHDTLGAGFMLASHDLEIRGAGELLGEGQSGQIQEIGFGLYSELLERAVKALKSGKQPELETSLHHGIEVDLGEPALIPEDYLPDIHTRLTLYKRIANAQNLEQLHELEVEMIDRFGLLPPQTQTLFAVTQLKLEAEPYNLKKIEAGDGMIRIQFGQQPNIDPLKLIQLIQSQPKHYQLKGQTELKYFDTMETLNERIQMIQFILNALKVTPQ
jgi:transcription-repair coupling factor (superfamily II helicase)